MPKETSVVTATGRWTFTAYPATAIYDAGWDIDFRSIPEKWSHSTVAATLDGCHSYMERMEREWSLARKKAGKR